MKSHTSIKEMPRKNAIDTKKNTPNTRNPKKMLNFAVQKDS